MTADWLSTCRRATVAVTRAYDAFAGTSERAATRGRGEGGDTTLAIDAAAEDAVIAELEATGLPMTVVSEERGELALAGGGPVHVVVDPVDGSLNAKRGLPFWSVSIAVAEGATMDSVRFGYVSEPAAGREWWAERGGGAFRDGERLELRAGGELELLAIETARPRLLAEAMPGIVALEARRIRALGSVAISLCLVAGGMADAMASLRPIRSVDAAAGQLLVLEAGGAVAFPEAGEAAPLGLAMRSRVLAAPDYDTLERVLACLPSPGPG
jgi:myo-inositol-1(or 4)-monophosphatase